MRKISRDEKLLLKSNDNFNFEIRDRDGKIIYNEDSEFFIYMKNVNFRNGNTIQGRYLGNITKDSSILDDNCKMVSNVDGEFKVDGKIVRTGRMVAVNNNNEIILIIANS